ncbi:replication initiation protein [Acidocella aromatica]|uniref:Plasmid replication initiation protein n=1 Tax=Acidocella aromatica TaxID=1303579 RepID=A0A840VN48_9PROT|nr:replication initiation protein [Acidocella aromatica]MBB5374545.1 plasmid replication initiation protein [Acidocella aromatica]
MALTIQQKTNAVGFPKPAELIEITGTSGLEAQDRALMNALYMHAHDSGDLAKPGAKWELPLASLNFSTHNTLDRVRESLSRLLGVQVAVTYFDPERAEEVVLQTVLFEHFITSKKGAPSATLRFAIPSELRGILARSDRWGRIKAEVVHAMSSKYAIALYELLRLRANMDNCVETFTYERFRDLLGVPKGTYEAGKDFKVRVIDPAVLEINGLSEMGCQIDLFRVHSRAAISKVTVAWWKKGAEEQRSAVQELNRSKLGRKARLRGQVETIQTQEAIA